MPRKSNKSTLPPPLEMACLIALSKLGVGSVGDVQRAIEPAHKLAYTTVQTSMNRLWRRGVVERLPGAWRVQYRPLVTVQELRSAAVDELAGLYFDGSRKALQEWLNGDRAETPAQPAEPAFDPTLL